MLVFDVNSIMNEILSAHFIEWFLPKALAGLAIGYALRIIEHYVWLKHEGKSEEFFFWSLAVLMQSICLGGPLAYIIVGILVHKIPGKNFIIGAAYVVPVFTSFMAVDARELVRRIRRA